MISIVCPVYNRERYLSATVDSVLNQTYKDFELILVDDGSTDSSYSIMQEYAEKDSRVKIFTKENSGASSAREMGYNSAIGDFFILLDSDDLWKDKMLEEQMREMESGDYDGVYVLLSEMTNNEIDDASLSFLNENNLKKESCSGIDIYKRLSKGEKIATSWAVLYKKTFFDKAIKRFIDVKDLYPFGYFNDSMISAQITCECEKAALLDDVFVFVRVNDDSICRTVKILPHNLEKIEHFKKKIEFIKEINDPYPYGHELVGYYMTMLGIWSRILLCDKTKYKDNLDSIDNYYRMYYSDLLRVKLDISDNILRAFAIIWRCCPRITLFMMKKLRLKV